MAALEGRDHYKIKKRVESLSPPNQQVLIQVWLAVTEGHQHVALFRKSLCETVCGTGPAAGKEEMNTQRKQIN